MKRLLSFLFVASLLFMAGCTRITNGEIGLRQSFNKTIDMTELQPGSWNQHLFGEVLVFPVKQIAVNHETKSPLTADNTALAQFHMTVVYNLNPAGVRDLYTTRAPVFHAIDDKGETLLMYNYIDTLINNASYKAIRKYQSLTVADNRELIEADVKEHITTELKNEGLQANITIGAVQVKTALPAPEILASATAAVNAQNNLKVKTTEVEIAKKESERMAALSANSTASIAYMNAQANLNISEGVKNGRVGTIIVPGNFTSLGNLTK